MLQQKFKPIRSYRHLKKQKNSNLLMSNFSEFVRIVDSVCISQGERASPSAVFCCSNLSAISFNVLCNQKYSSAYLDCNKCCCVGFVWSWSSLAGLLWHQREFFIQRTAALFPLCQTLLCKPRREITADQQLLKHSDSWSGTNNHAMWLVSPFFTITITTQIHEKKKRHISVQIKYLVTSMVSVSEIKQKDNF